MKPSTEKSADQAATSDVLTDTDTSGGSRPKNGGRQIGELQRLLFGPDAISEALPEAVTKSSEKSDDLSEATLPIVEGNIRDSVVRNPKILADALFPVIGPAIRKAITSALNSMVQSFNQILEHSVSPKGLRWRLEAMRTGRSFGEVVLLKTLLYRVEQVFLIQRETGLLLEHVSQNPQDVEDVDMVSAMLTAITDFARDSFDTGEDSTLDSFNVSGLNVWVESGPNAILAAVIRGNPPVELRDIFSDALEKIHYKFEREFDTYKGDPAIFAASQPFLQSCLVSQLAEQGEEKRRRFSPAHLILGLFGILLLLVVGYFAWDYWRWSGLLEDIRNEPGYVLTDERRGWVRHSVAGLRDPLSRNPSELLQGNRYDDEDVVFKWREFHDTVPEFELERARSILQPPSGVALEIRNGILAVSGDASAEWIANAKRTGPLVAGVNQVRVEEGASSVVSKIENTKLLFECGTADIKSGTAIEPVAGDMRKLAAFGPYKIDIVGYADQSGTPVANREISLRRSKAVAEALGELLTGQDANLIFNETRAEASSDECKVTFRVTPLSR